MCGYQQDVKLVLLLLGLVVAGVVELMLADHLSVSLAARILDHILRREAT